MPGATAELVVVALAVDGCCEDRAQQRRGVRIELTDQTIAESVYIEQKDIGLIARAVEGLERELVAGHLPVVDPRELGPGADLDQISACHGRGEFRFAESPFDQFMVDYCAAARWSGLSIFVSSVEHRFNFPGLRPADLVRLLEQALVTLST